MLEKYEQVFMWAGREGVEKKVLVRGGRASKVVWSVFGLGEFEKSREAGKRSLHLRVLVSWVWRVG